MHLLLKLLQKCSIYLGKTIKAVVYAIEDKVILAMVRGDHDVNEVAVQHAVNGSVEPECNT